MKLNPEEKLRQFLRSKYMISENMNDRITDHRDWKDGINQFRLRMLDEIKLINMTLDNIKKKLDEEKVV